VAQTKKRRRRKNRGTQGGRIDTNRRTSRPRSREEARARARARVSRKPGSRQDLPPTWRGASIRGALAALVLAVLFILIFKRDVGVSIALAAVMLIVYIPAGYYIDMALWRRRERARIRAREDQ
jgi:hypothetical protein